MFFITLPVNDEKHARDHNVSKHRLGSCCREEKRVDLEVLGPLALAELALLCEVSTKFTLYKKKKGRMAKTSHTDDQGHC